MLRSGSQTFGDYSHAEGIGTITLTTASYSHAEGYYTTASGDASHAEGSRTFTPGTTAMLKDGMVTC
jgi:trimeric autotransporter adhesin